MKTFYIQHNIGKAKYCVNHHDGVATHKDGSAFYDLAIFNNKRQLKAFIKKLTHQQYKGL